MYSTELTNEEIPIFTNCVSEGEHEIKNESLLDHKAFLNQSEILLLTGSLLRPSIALLINLFLNLFMTNT
jgi:hypothetical protein